MTFSLKRNSSSGLLSMGDVLRESGQGSDHTLDSQLATFSLPVFDRCIWVNSSLILTRTGASTALTIKFSTCPGDLPHIMLDQNNL